MPRIKVQLADNIKRVVTFDTDATIGATLGTNLFLPDGSVGTPTTVLAWLGGALPSAPVSGSSGGGGVPISSYLTTKGDLLTRDTQVQRLPIGAEDETLRVSAGGLAEWRGGAELSTQDDTNVTLVLSGTPATSLLKAVDIQVVWSGVLAVPRGGTGHSEYALGSILYADTEVTLEALAPGADGWVLTMYGGYPSWSPPSGGGIVEIVPGTGIAVDDTDPDYPIVSLDAGISDLNDVDLSGLTDGDVLVWDNSTSQWVATSAPAGGVESVVEGTGIAVDDTDPANPIVSLDAAVGDLNDVDLTDLADGFVLVYDASTNTWVAAEGGGGASDSAPETRGASWSAGTAAIVAPTNDVPVYIREDCTLHSVIILTRGGTGSCEIDIWKKPYGTYPPTVANSICPGVEPAISSGVTYQNTTLTGFNTALSADDTLLIHLETSSTFTTITVFLVLIPVGSTPYDGYTDERVREVMEAALQDTETVQWSFNDLANTIEADVPVFTDYNNGAVPASSNDPDEYLCADGTWKVPPGSGSVTETTGTFTGTLTYGVTPPTVTTNANYRWTKIGNLVTLFIPEHVLTSVASSGTSMILSGLPVGIQPVRPTSVPIFTETGGGAFAPGALYIFDSGAGNAGSAQLAWFDPNSGANGALATTWPAPQTIGFNFLGFSGDGQSITYSLN